MSSACFEITLLRGVFRELGFHQLHSTPFYVDNTSAIQITNNLVFHEYMKHIKVDSHSKHESFDDMKLHFLTFSPIFRCVCFVHLSSTKRHKFASQSVTCAFIGYNPT